jgi:hypothetical protein
MPLMNEELSAYEWVYEYGQYTPRPQALLLVHVLLHPYPADSLSLNDYVVRLAKPVRLTKVRAGCAYGFGTLAPVR